jgi:hypothetical protein
MKFIIRDTQTSEVVASRGTKASAVKWATGLNAGLQGRYVVVKVMA